MHAITKLAITIGLATTAISLSKPAEAACGPAFNGVWETLVISSQGQYTQSRFINNSKNGALHANTETGTRLSSGGYILSTIFDIAYNKDLYKNISAKITGKNTCTLIFKRPHVNKDAYGVVRGVVARQARLKASGKSIQWCWLEKGHQLGDCMPYRQTDTLK